MSILTMEEQLKQSPKLIRTSVGNQYTVSYIGSIGDARCYKCKDSQTGTVWYVATLGDGFGPMCKHYVEAAMRARNVALAKDILAEKMLRRQK